MFSLRNANAGVSKFFLITESVDEIVALDYCNISTAVQHYLRWIWETRRGY